MRTPALRPFLKGVGRVVHHLNTIAVGLAGVESGGCKKPDGMDISWDPKDLTTSSRGARCFALNSSLVFVAEELAAYVHSVRGLPGMENTLGTNSGEDKASRFVALVSALGIDESDLAIGPALTIHWRNRLIHKNSKAALTKNQKRQFLESAPLLEKNYKNFCPHMALEHFAKRRATLKDVSSLTAMTINAVKNIDEKVPEPQNKEELIAWLDQLELKAELDRVKRVPAGNPERAVENFLDTYCPSLKASYYRFYTVDV